MKPLISCWPIQSKDMSEHNNGTVINKPLCQRVMCLSIFGHSSTPELLWSGVRLRTSFKGFCLIPLSSYQMLSGCFTSTEKQNTDRLTDRRTANQPTIQPTSQTDRRTDGQTSKMPAEKVAEPVKTNGVTNEREDHH